MQNAKDIHAEKVYASVATSRSFRNLSEAFGLGRRAVLDIGCGYGQYLRRFGPDSTGISIEPAEAEAARRHGVRVTLGNIEDEGFSPAPHDVIWCNNIFEHLESPHRFLMRARAWVRPAGRMILGVPVLPRIRPLRHLKKFAGALTTPHINFFTIDTLAETVRRGGWRVIDARPFFLKNPLLDRGLNALTPHAYVIAEPITGFQPTAKRALELEALDRFKKRS